MDHFKVIASLLFIGISAHQVGKSSTKFGLPIISGFIFAGILAGPYVLDFISQASFPYLNVVDTTALAFIALVAGFEVHLDELNRRFRAILTISASCAVLVVVCSTTFFFFFSDQLSFFQGMSSIERFGAALVSSTILIAISPSSAIAVLKELRAKGKFTQVVLGVTLFMDVVVVFLFAITSLVADTIFHSVPFDFIHIFFLILELLANILMGIVIGYVIKLILFFNLPEICKIFGLLIVGFSVFFFSTELREMEVVGLALPLFSEPLLVCMVSGLFLANRTKYRTEIDSLVNKTSPYVFVLFFTLVGVELNIGILRDTWIVGVAILLVRFFAMVVGAIIGSSAARVLASRRHLLGLAFISQAGISLTLAKELGASFGDWGEQVSALIIAIIVGNTLIGPIFLKLSIKLAKEAHSKAMIQRGLRQKAAIFGIGPQSLLLARQLISHNWGVLVVDRKVHQHEFLNEEECRIEWVDNFSQQNLQTLDLAGVNTFVLMLDDDSNFALAEIAFELLGIEDIIVKLNYPENINKFREIGVLVVEPEGAMANLLDHFVRSPAAASLLMGREIDKDVIEVTLSNEDLHGFHLRDLHLPNDTLVLSVRREGKVLLSHGYTTLRLGDEVTIVGRPSSLEELQLRFSQ